MELLCVLLLFAVITRPSYQEIYTCNVTASCGCSTQTAIVTKIVGGEAAQSNSWGWAVLLTYNSSYLLCGGTVLSSLWILTAAHCVIGKNVTLFTVYAGSIDMTSFSQSSTLATLYIHPNYSGSTHVNDIALLQLSTPFNMRDAGLAKICLPVDTTEIYPPIDSTLVAIGWGTLTENGSVSQILQQVTLQAVPYSSIGCNAVVYDTSTQFCASVNDSSKDTCQGDSGGPLMMFTWTQQWIVVGITSYGYGCAVAPYAGVYTRLTPYLDWIKSVNVTDTITICTSTTTTTTTMTTSTITTISSTTTTMTASTITTISSTIATTANRTGSAHGIYPISNLLLFCLSTSFILQFVFV